MTSVLKLNSRPVRWLAAAFACLLGTVTVAADDEPVDPKQETPHELVEKVTEVMFDIVKEYDGGEDDTQAYYQAIEEVLDPVVAFPYIAGAVMGSHGEDATNEQKRKFIKVFRRGLIETYAKGIAGYTDSEIRIVPPKEGDKNSRRVSVDQEVKHDGSTYELSYTMLRSKSGEWKLINLVLDGVNLGRSLRSQFSQAAKKYDGDLDKVIDNWLDEV